MEIDKAINILKDHNLWRRGSDEKKMADPKELGIAFVKVIAFAEETRALQLLQTDVSSAFYCLDKECEFKVCEKQCNSCKTMVKK